MRLLLAREAQPVPENELVNREVKRVTNASVIIREGFVGCVEGRAEARGQSKEAGQATLNDTIEGGPKAQCMIAPHIAAIILDLIVVLESLLWRQQIWPYNYLTTN